MKIVTNNQPRQLLDWDNLTPKEQKELDYFDPSEDSGNFFRYKGQVYDLGEFMRVDSLPGWDGASAQSAFHGVLVKVVGDCQSVIVGSFYS